MKNIAGLSLAIGIFLLFAAILVRPPAHQFKKKAFVEPSIQLHVRKKQKPRTKLPPPTSCKKEKGVRKVHLDFLNVDVNVRFFEPLEKGKALVFWVENATHGYILMRGKSEIALPRVRGRRVAVHTLRRNGVIFSYAALPLSEIAYMKKSVHTHTQSSNIPTK